MFSQLLKSLECPQEMIHAFEDYNRNTNGKKWDVDAVNYKDFFKAFQNDGSLSFISSAIDKKVLIFRRYLLKSNFRVSAFIRLSLLKIKVFAPGIRNRKSKIG